MITYIKMKKKEWEVKKALYSTIAAIIKEKKEIAKTIQKIYTAIKEIPAEELQKEIIAKMVETIHPENK